MKRSMISLVLLVVVGVLCAWGFDAPSGEQIKNAAEDPNQIAALIANASTEEAADVIVAVVREIDKMELTLEEKQAKVEDLFVAVQKAWGDKAMVLLAMTAERVNPELLPVVATPGVRSRVPAAPPIGQRYLGQ